MQTCVPPDPVSDPDELASLVVQQYLRDMGFTTALQSIEQQTHRKFLDSKLPRGSMLLEMVYRHLEAEAGGDDEAEANGRARMAEEALLNASEAALPDTMLSAFEGGHSAAVTSLEVSGDGAALYSGTGSGVVRRLTAAGDEVWSASLCHGGVLSMALLPAAESRQERLVAATMDGSVALLDAEAGTQLAVLQPHRKYVVKALCLQAAGDTRTVTGSWDGTLAVHQLSADGNSMETLTVESFDHGIADLALLPDGRTVVVAVKDTPFLHLYDAHELQETRKVNMNDKEWDDTLSFSATTVAVSPCGSFLLVSTDGPRMMVFRTRDWSNARILYGLQTAVSFHHYCAIWWGSAHVLAAAAGGAVFAFSTSSGKVVSKLAAHPGSNVRTMVADEAHGRLYTGSFDKSVRVFGSG